MKNYEIMPNDFKDDLRQKKDMTRRLRISTTPGEGGS